MRRHENAVTAENAMSADNAGNAGLSDDVSAIACPHQNHMTNKSATAEAFATLRHYHRRFAKSEVLGVSNDEAKSENAEGAENAGTGWNPGKQ